jgi:hypothetical protein
MSNEKRGAERFINHNKPAMGSTSSKQQKQAEERDMSAMATCYKLESDLFLNASRNQGAPPAWVETMDDTGGVRRLLLPAYMNVMRPDKTIESHHGRVVS